MVPMTIYSVPSSELMIRSLTEEQLQDAPKIEQGETWEQANRDRDEEVHGYWARGARAPNFIPDHKRQRGGNAGL
jgi:hypothetical protein